NSFKLLGFRGIPRSLPVGFSTVQHIKAYTAISASYATFTECFGERSTVNIAFLRRKRLGSL
ncbi:MAG: hypothetical protein FGF50_10400, partial [Candidatus Brockarchaeota archaeon]|nr:hypothetical protein [Candidatus Brockarchaeota archaeon]